MQLFFGTPLRSIRRWKLSILQVRMWNFTRKGCKTKKLRLSIVPARKQSDQPGLRPPKKGANYHFSQPHLDDPYVGKLSILEALICSFSRIAQKIKNYSSFNFLAENLEKFRSTEHYGAALEGSTIFLCHSSLGCTSMESCQLADLKYAIFSRKGCKTKNYRARSSFYRWSLSMGS